MPLVNVLDLECEIKTNGELKEKLLESIQENHLWLNAFKCINPSDEFCARIGRSILERLDSPHYLLPSYHGDDDDAPISDMQSITKVMYIRVNKS